MSEPNGGSRAGRPARPRSLQCRQCGGVVSVRASGLSVSAICTSCGALLDVNNPAVQLIAAAQERTITPLIAIGRRGTLAGTEWEVIGYQERSSEGGAWSWEEYLLFNPYRGFRFLGVDHGHWTLYCMLREAVGEGGAVPGDPHQYQADATGLARTDYVLGEFYWRARAGDVVAFAEYVDPPYILSMERGAGEVIWSRGVYLQPDVVKVAFSLAMLPRIEGTAPHQPGWSARRSAPTPAGKRVWWTAAVFAAVLMVLEVVPFGRDFNRAVYQQVFTIAKGDKDRSLSSPAFTVPDAAGNVTLVVGASVWPGGLKLDLALAAADGSRRFDFPLLFASFADDEANYPRETFASVPGGLYRLLADVDATAVVQPSLSISVWVLRHTPDAGNFFIALVLILLWPITEALAGWIERLRRGSGR